MILKRDFYKYPLLLVDLIEVIWRTFVVAWKNFIFMSGKKVKTSPSIFRKNGLHVLLADSTGKIKCDGCKVCEEQCPARCIAVESSGNNLKSFKINLLKCTFCRVCEEVCPIDAIYFSEREVGPGLVEQPWVYDQKILAYRKDISPLDL